MRLAVASLMALVLLSILTVCPLMACGPVPDNRCCHDSSCPKTAVQECPYVLLGKGKTATATAHLLNATLDPVSPGLNALGAYTPIGIESRISSSHGLYLHIRVLLI